MFVCVFGGGVITAVVSVPPIALRAVALAALILTGFPLTANFAEIDPAETVVCAMHVDAMAPASAFPSLWSVPASAPDVRGRLRGVMKAGVCVGMMSVSGGYDTRLRQKMQWMTLQWESVEFHRPITSQYTDPHQAC